jgi:DNA-binding NarL/FixJ family response regulator
MTANQFGGHLSEREIIILKLLSTGCADFEIGTVLNLHVGTVRNHIHRLLLRLGLRNRTQLAIAAYQFGVTDPFTINLWIDEDDIDIQ